MFWSTWTILILRHVSANNKYHPQGDSLYKGAFDAKYISLSSVRGDTSQS